MRQLPPLAAMRAFEAAGRNENFTSAAAELGMTQAAVSYQVRMLEERLSAPLFVREKGRVRLSALGSRLLPPLTSAFDTIESRVRQSSPGGREPADRDHHAHLRQHLAGVAAGRVPDGASRPCGQDDDQQRHRRSCARARPMSRCARGRAAGKGSTATGCSTSAFTPMANPDCIAAAERTGRAARCEPADLLDLQLISQGDDWWDQWFGDNGVDDRPRQAPSARESGSITRPMRDMRRWRGRASPC